MKGTLSSLLCWSAVVLATAGSCGSAHAAEVKNARVWAGSAYTRVVFDLSGPVRYQVAQHGDQVVIGLPGSRLAGDFDGPAAQGRFRGLTETRQGGRLQLLARVVPGSIPHDFLLGPSGHAGYRLVLDLYPASGASAARAGTVAATSSRVATTGKAHRPVDFSRLDARQVAALLGGERKVIVAVDPGHGGKDPGAHGPHGTLEKNVTLAVGRDLAADIDAQPGMQAILTRNGDYYVPLAKRYEIARAAKADLFVAIHADSAYDGADARGSSVWMLSSRGKSSVAARWLADRENSADLIGGVSLAAVNGSLASVLLNMQQGWAVQASQEVANDVFRQLAMIGPTHRDHIERANFVVLRSPDVPSILVETAFISNPAEELKLRNPAHQRALAQAIMTGIQQYFETSPSPGTWFAAQAARRMDLHEVASHDARHAPTALDHHRVVRGESLGSIAQHYGVSVRSLKSINGISTDTVRAGMVLMIPPAS